MIQGLDAYATLYADSRRWLREAWVDYLAPRLYWSFDSPGQSYPKLLAWWQQQNTHGRHLWPGNYTSRLGPPDNPQWQAEEIIRQVSETRRQLGAGGNIHFSMKALMKNWGGVADQLIDGPGLDHNSDKC